MIEILSQDTTAMQNVYTPLPMNIHLIFCIIATVVYLAQYARKGAVHYLLLMLAVDLTFVTQICTTNAVIGFLFAAEVVLLICSGVFSYRFNKKQKADEKAPAAADDGDGFDDDFE